MISILLFVLGTLVAAEAMAVVSAPARVREMIQAMSDGELKMLGVVEGLIAAALIYAGFAAR